MKRAIVLGVGVVLTGALSACSGSQGAENQQSPPGNETSAPSQSNAITVQNPKNPPQDDPCSLLAPGDASSLGFAAEGELSESISDPEAPPRCAWQTPDESTQVSLSVLTDGTLQSYYDNASQYVDFAKWEIADHPAVRANTADPMKDGGCAVFLAPDEQRVVAATAILGSKDVGKKDPCALSRQVLEKAVPTWPSAK